MTPSSKLAGLSLGRRIDVYSKRLNGTTVRHSCVDLDGIRAGRRFGEKRWQGALGRERNGLLERWRWYTHVADRVQPGHGIHLVVASAQFDSHRRL